jgi:hypothetical protein
MDTKSLDCNIIMTIDRLTIPSRDENASPNCPFFQSIVDEFATLDERKRETALMLQLKDYECDYILRNRSCNSINNRGITRESCRPN